ncbi:peptidase [Haloprofundus marisrubri]|uniref:Peptidase n=1 Tax=Haloprofundus marisrubri TaxID=1514971 RepID=A0A0W1R7P8_9EURY|nr:desampylase [Haloprofundus marisrubri]KTG09454.1 peptidase [Haloprofundus marisrubri]
MPSSHLSLSTAAADSIFSHARDGASGDTPREVCGVLVGDRGDENTPDTVTGVRRVPNVAADPRTRYELDPETTLEAIESAENAGRDVVGFYHSHPESPARPSETDRKEATWKGYVYLIVSPRNDEIRAWRWSGERFETLGVETE